MERARPAMNFVRSQLLHILTVYNTLCSCYCTTGWLVSNS